MTTSTEANKMTTRKYTAECLECGKTWKCSAEGLAMGNVRCSNGCAVIWIRLCADR